MSVFLFSSAHIDNCNLAKFGFVLAKYDNLFSCSTAYLLPDDDVNACLSFNAAINNCFLYFFFSSVVGIDTTESS